LFFIKNITLAVIIVFILTGCAVVDGGTPQYTETNTQFIQLETEAVPESVTYTELALLYGIADVGLAALEPSGMLFGADISDDGVYNGDIDAYEKMAGTSHSIYQTEMRLGGEYPRKFILSCLAAEKTPCIIIRPPTSGDKYDCELLEQTAATFAEIQTPMFIAFYPYSAAEWSNAAEYIEFFEQAKETFAGYAPFAAIIWQVDAADVYYSPAFYPECAGWVGLTIKASLVETNGVCGYGDVLERIDSFYRRYQHEKPIMLSLSVSHYTSVSNKYETAAAAEFLADFYAKITNIYPRVKSVIYVNINELTTVSQRPRENFLVYDEPLRTAYADALSGADWRQGGGAEFYLSACTAYIGTDGEAYIPAISLAEELGVTAADVDSDAIIYINGNACYSARDAMRLFGVRTETNPDKKRISIYVTNQPNRR